MPNKQYRIPVQYIFEGEFVILAQSKEIAEKNVTEHCGVVLGSVQSTLPDGEVDWDIPMFPIKKMGRARIVLTQKKEPQNGSN